MNTLCIGPFYVTLGRQGGGSPLVDECTTIESGGRLRVGHGRLIRLPFTGHRSTVGLIVGRWLPPATGPASPPMTAPRE